MKFQLSSFSIFAILFLILSCIPGAEAGKKSALAFYGLEGMEADYAYAAGGRANFQVKWMKWSRNLNKLKLYVRRPFWFSKKYEIYDVQYSKPNMEGWIDVSVRIPKVEKSAKYYFYWKNWLGRTVAQSPRVHILAPEVDNRGNATLTQ